MSVDDGHRLVLNAFSESRVVFDGAFRLEWVIKEMTLWISPDEKDEGHAWEWRTSALGLLNALSNTPEGVEERCEITGELQRHGLLDALEVSAGFQ
jgi:hypothetical protein